MSIPEVVVHPREGAGKGDSRRLRRQGVIPSVIYGLKGDPRSVTVEPKIINKIIRSEKGLNTVMNMRLGDSDLSGFVMIKAMNRHPVTDRLIHVDFLRIDMGQEVHSMIPVEIVGIPSGAKLGGILTVVRHEIEISCLPKNLPGKIVVDVSDLEMDEARRIQDLPEIPGVKYLLAPEKVIAVVHPPEQEAAADEDADGASVAD